MKRGSCFIIILNWNGWSDTAECVESCLPLSSDYCRIVIVDNSSTDGSCEILQLRFPGITIIRNSENLGFAGGNNVGIRYALENGAEYIWLLNNDTTVAPDALSRLLSAAAVMKQGGIFGGKILFSDSPDIINSAGGSINRITGQPSLTGYGETDDGRFDEIREVETVSGCSFFIRSETIRDTGLMDERFFLYFEESDWCARARKAGHNIFYIPAARIWHKGAVSTGGEDSPLVKYYMTRNNILFMKKNAPAPLYPLFLANYLLNLMPREMARMIFTKKEGRLPRVKAMLLGIFDYFRGKFGRCETV